MLSGPTIGALSDMLASSVNVIKKFPLSLTFMPHHAEYLCTTLIPNFIQLICNYVFPSRMENSVDPDLRVVWIYSVFKKR